MPTHGPTRRSQPAPPAGGASPAGGAVGGTAGRLTRRWCHTARYGPGVRRDALSALGIQLPVLPTVALGALPGPPEWAARLERLGLDVVASGAAVDTPATWGAAAGAVRHRPCKACAGDPGPLVAAGCRIVETRAAVPAAAYRLGPDDAVVDAVIGSDPAVEDLNDVGRRVLARAREGAASALWVVATPGLELLDDARVEAKLAALVEGTRQARLALAKEQFEL